MDTHDDASRFGGIARLYGADALHRLMTAHVAVVGLGGVGSWAAEALVRSGVGKMTLVDLDDICVTNVNRQLHATQETLGQLKVGAMADRLREISPNCTVHACANFFTASSADEILAPRFDFVVDAIDALNNKCLLIAKCLSGKIPIVVSGSAGGRREPTAIRVADLAATSHDPLLAQVRAQLKRQNKDVYNTSHSGIPTVYTTELPVFPGMDGTICSRRPSRAEAGEMRMNCDSGMGSASFVTGAFGLVAASVVVKSIALPPANSLPRRAHSPA